MIELSSRLGLPTLHSGEVRDTRFLLAVAIQECEKIFLTTNATMESATVPFLLL